MIENQIHTFIEKPITSNYSESKKLLEIASKNNVLVQVGHVERFNPALQSLKEHTLKPLFIEVHRLSQFKTRATDVSVVYDLMIHDIDIILWLVKSKVKKIEANGVAIITDTPDIANARITFENGTIANLTASRISASQMRKLRIFQRDAYFSIDLGNQQVDVFKLLDGKPDAEKYPIAFNLGSILETNNPKNIVYQKPEVPKLNAIQEEQKSFINSILSKQPIAVTASEASEAVRIAEIISKKIKNYNKSIQI
jgi:predicted dehydrogenase